MLRRNRMKPRGLVAAKKAFSASLRTGPVQPKITARGGSRSAADNDAPDTALAQRAAKLIRRRPVTDRAGLDAVNGIAAALAAHHGDADAAEHVAIVAP